MGVEHEGIELRFSGRGHRIDFAALTGRGVWLDPQHEVLIDLIAPGSLAMTPMVTRSRPLRRLWSAQTDRGASCAAP